MKPCLFTSILRATKRPRGSPQSMLKRLTALPAALLLFPLLTLNGCTCGFDCSDGDDDDGNTPTTSLFSLSLSDALPEELEEVVIEITSVTLRRSGADDVVISTFIDPEDPNAPRSESVDVDLLQYPGANQFKLIEGLTLDHGDYNDLVLEIVSGDLNRSYVLESSGQQLPIEVTNGALILEGIAISEELEAYTVEFELARSLDFEVDNNVYRLGTEGVRVVEDARAVTLRGTVDEDLFDTDPLCDEKNDPLTGNRVYLYEGNSLNTSDLADVFNASGGGEPPSSAIAPYAVTEVIRNETAGAWEYYFGFLPRGDYTVAFACDTEDDDPADYDGLAIPLPEGQVREVVLSSSNDSEQCDFKEDSSGC